MVIIKKITGKKQILTSTTELHVGDSVTIMERHGKKKKRSLDIYKVTGWNSSHKNVMVVIEYDGIKKNQKTVALEDIRLEFITEVEIHEIAVEFTCREAGLQRAIVCEHDFEFGVQDCEICGSHGNLAVDLKCKCGKTHTIELKSW